MREAKIDRMSLTDVFVEPGRRVVDPDVVARLQESILKIGLMTPITVKIVDKYIDPVEGEIDKAPVLVSGRHRLEAVRALGHKEIDCFVWDDPNSARMWEIAENLHRSELTAQQRADNIAEWIELNKLPQVGAVSGGRGKKAGIREAARNLPISGGTAKAREHNAARAVKIASITPAAKEAAREAGLDDNQRALLQIAAAPASQQVAVVESISERAIERRSRRPQVGEQGTPHERDLNKLRALRDKSCISARRAFVREETDLLRDLAA